MRLKPQLRVPTDVLPHVGELKYLNRFFWKYRLRLALGIVFICISNYFQVLQPQVIREALDLVIDYVNAYGVYDGFAVQGEFFGILSHTLMLFAGLVLLLALIMGFFLYLTRQTIIVMSRLIEYDLREVIFQHYEDLSLEFYKRNNTGDLMSRITEDVNKVRMYLGPAVMYMANLVSTIIFVIASMLAVSPTLTLYTLIPLPVLAVSIYYVSNIIHNPLYPHPAAAFAAYEYCSGGLLGYSRGEELRARAAADPPLRRSERRVQKYEREPSQG